MNTIRRAQEHDIPRLLELLVQVDMVHHNGRPDLFKGPATKYGGDELRAMLKNDGAPIFVCCDGSDRVLGYAFCQLRQLTDDRVLTDIKTLYIDDLCVDEAIRSQGVGSALYGHVLAYARSLGCYNVTLNVWSCNPSALRFYEHCGLVPQKIGMETIL